MTPYRFCLIVLFAGVAQAQAPPAKDRPKGTTVTGRVVSEPGGKPEAGVVVTLWNGNGGENSTSRTDDAGVYSFANVEPGDYYKVWIQERPKTEVGVWSEGVVVQVKDRPVRAGDLFRMLPQSISGMVIDLDTGKPVPGANINFSTADNNRDGVTTDSEGRYCLFVTPREVELECYGTDERYEGSRQTHKVTVVADKHIKGIDFKVKSGPKFTGLVLFQDGKPAKGLEVLVELWRLPLAFDGNDAGSGRHFRVNTDEKGRFLGYMRVGEARDRMQTVALKAIARLPDGTLGGVADAKTSTKEEYKVNPLKVVLAKTAGVKFRVADPDGMPITNANVTASDINSGWYWHNYLGGPVNHLGEGKYLMTNLIPGLEYHLAIERKGHQTGTQKKKLVLNPDEIRELGDIRLEWWGKKAVPGLLNKLQSADMYDRETAAHQLGQLGADADAAVPALIEKLNQDPTNTVRYGVAAALGKIGPAAKLAVPSLLRALQEDTGGGVQREAATALGLIGDLSALPFLRNALKNPDRDVQNAAAESVERLEKVLKKPAPAK